MKKSSIKIVIMILVLITSSKLLIAQESLGNHIEISFYDLHCQSPYQEWSDFFNDYDEYKLTLMYRASIYSASQCGGGMFVYDPSTIELNDITQVLQEDYRVRNVNHEVGLPRPRQLALKLIDQAEEWELMYSYYDYGFNGSQQVPGWFGLGLDKRFYCFNDTIVYPGDLINLLRADERVEFFTFVHAWSDGNIMFEFHRFVTEAMKQEFYQEYPDIEFHHVLWWIHANFDFIMYNEFELLYLFQNDARVEYAELNIFGWPPIWGYCSHPPIVSSIDETINDTIPVIVYPNPMIGNGVVTFKHSNILTNSEISIYNIKGQLVKKTRFIEDTYFWNGKDENETQVNSGIYLYQIKSETEVHTGKILIIK